MFKPVTGYQDTDSKEIYQIGNRLKTAIIRLYTHNERVTAIDLVREILDCGLITAKELSDFIFETRYQ